MIFHILIMIIFESVVSSLADLSNVCLFLPEQKRRALNIYIYSLQPMIISFIHGKQNVKNFLSEEREWNIGTPS